MVLPLYATATTTTSQDARLFSMVHHLLQLWESIASAVILVSVLEFELSIALVSSKHAQRVDVGMGLSDKASCYYPSGSHAYICFVIFAGMEWKLTFA